MVETPPDHDFLEQALPRAVKGALHVTWLVTNLLYSEQFLSCACAECFYAHTIPIVAAFPGICEPPRSEREAGPLVYVLWQEYARTR